MAGLAGVLMAPLSTLSPTMGVNPLLTSFVVVIVGGIGSVAGAIAASFIVAIELSFVGTYWSGPGSVLVSFAVAFVILSLRPTGLFGAGVS